MVRTQIQLTEEQARRLKAIAQEQNVSVAELIRRGVDQLIASSPAVDVAERRRRAVEVVGRFGSGKRDTSREHDRYLADAYRT